MLALAWTRSQAALASAMVSGLAAAPAPRSPPSPPAASDVGDSTGFCGAAQAACAKTAASAAATRTPEPRACDVNESLENGQRSRRARLEVAGGPALRSGTLGPLMAHLRALFSLSSCHRAEERPGPGRCGIPATVSDRSTRRGRLRLAPVVPAGRGPLLLRVARCRARRAAAPRA